MKVMGVVGWKNAGKTTLVVRLVSAIVARGYSVSTVKHAHHAFDIDQPGKDSFLHRSAGATEVLVTSGARWALMHELRDETEPSLDEHLAKLSDVEVVLVEGFKHHPHSKIEVYRQGQVAELIAPNDPQICAIATDFDHLSANCPVLPLNDPDQIADFVLSYLSLPARKPGS